MPFPPQRKHVSNPRFQRFFLLFGSIAIVACFMGLGGVLPLSWSNTIMLLCFALVLVLDWRDTYGPQWYRSVARLVYASWRLAKNPRRSSFHVLHFISVLPVILFSRLRSPRFHDRYAAAGARAKRWHEALWRRLG